MKMFIIAFWLGKCKSCGVEDDVREGYCFSCIPPKLSAKSTEETKEIIRACDIIVDATQLTHRQVETLRARLVSEGHDVYPKVLN